MKERAEGSINQMMKGEEVTMTSFLCIDMQARTQGGFGGFDRTPLGDDIRRAITTYTAYIYRQVYDGHCIYIP